MDNSEKLSLFRKGKSIGSGLIDVSILNKRNFGTLLSAQISFPHKNNSANQRYVGCSQDGSTSYVDWLAPGETVPDCDIEYSQFDGPGWCDWFYETHCQ